MVCPEVTGESGITVIFPGFGSPWVEVNFLHRNYKREKMSRANAGSVRNEDNYSLENIFQVLQTHVMYVLQRKPAVICSWWLVE